MKKLIFLFTLILSLFFINPVLAQENIDAQDSNPSFEYFKVEVRTGPQSAWNKTVPIYVKFIATIDSDKVQIDWDVPYGLEVTPKHPKFVTVKAGQTYQYKATVKPSIEGTYNIAANVIAWQYNNNFTSAGNTFIKFSKNLLTDPVSNEYRLGVVIKWLLLVVFIVVIGFIGYIYAIKSKRKFDRWFNLPE